MYDPVTTIIYVHLIWLDSRLTGLYPICFYHFFLICPDIIAFDNRRSPNSEITGRSEDDFGIEKIEMENPEYSVKSRFRKDIHGLRDDMMPEELKQQEYIEIDLYPGYERLLPQLFLTETGKIMLYAMGEYFLLERKSERLL